MSSLSSFSEGFSVGDEESMGEKANRFAQDVIRQSREGLRQCGNPFAVAGADVMNDENLLQLAFQLVDGNRESEKRDGKDYTLALTMSLLTLLMAVRAAGIRFARTSGADPK
jgi:hypothetical protein